MSRRAGTERAAENQQTIKNLLKLEGNKVCADCKKNKRTSSSSQYCCVMAADSLQIRDGQAGTLESLFAFAAQASIEGWELISVE
jgi:hypothetical protein